MPQSQRLRESHCVHTSGLTFPLRCAQARRGKEDYLWQFVSMSYIKEDTISRMYLESYTKITENCFSFVVLLRFKPGCFHGNHTGPGSRFVTFGLLRELYDLSVFSFFLSETSLSSASRSVFLKSRVHCVTYLCVSHVSPSSGISFSLQSGLRCTYQAHYYPVMWTP